MGLSVCMIVKNEARNIVNAVLSARKVADELIILDTGSTDETRKLLDMIGQPYHTTEWKDSFAVARNESIALATKPWIFWMDADDVITDDCANRINKLKHGKPDTVYLFRIDLIDTEMTPDVGDSDKFCQLRMFPNGFGLKFENRVHEQVCGESLLTLNRGYAEDVIVEHHGYKEKKHQVESLRRNIRLQMIDIGFPAMTDFFSFEIGKNIFCIYCPDTLAIWYRKSMVCRLNPFDDGIPETNEGRFDKMVNRAKIYLSGYVDAIRIDKRNDALDWVEEIDDALNNGVVSVCAGY